VKARVLPGRRLPRLVCAGRGHSWQADRLADVVVVLCGRCSELVALADEPSTDPRSLLGSSTTGFAAVDVAAAVVSGDMAGVARARRALLSAPGDAVDSLTLLLVLLCRDGGDAAGLDSLRWAGIAAELALIEQEGAR
jgi:hypothetical protein